MADYYIGLMSGTSMDALDAVLVDLSEATPHLEASLSHPLPPTLRQQLIALTTPGANEIERSAQADRELGRFSAKTIQTLLEQTSITASQITAIGSHGQTIRHSPDSSPSYTVQIGDGNTIAQLTGITTVTDFRRRDMVVGGQGAPLVPAFHSALYRDERKTRVILNLGGIANISILPRDPHLPVSGFDTGPANVLLDSWCQAQRGEPFDKNGAWASSGQILPEFLQTLLDDPYFQRSPPKSTGREYFNMDWLGPKLPANSNSADVQATLSELTARTIAEAITQYCPDSAELIVCGGGAYNADLMQRLQTNLPAMPVVSSGESGISPRWMEAMAFAWLAHQTLRGLPGNLPTVTGASKPVILGAIYPGSPS
jgi:anhydro-N-acetylmuramic acid kinase